MYKTQQLHLLQKTIYNKKTKKLRFGITHKIIVAPYIWEKNVLVFGHVLGQERCGLSYKTIASLNLPFLTL